MHDNDKSRVEASHRFGIISIQYKGSIFNVEENNCCKTFET